jgi:adenylate kinase family enzyme
MEQVYRHVEPTVINVRPGDKMDELCAEIITNLEKEGFLKLDAENLRECEMKRKTNIGIEMIQHLHRDKNIPASMVVRMLNKIIYNGQESVNKFILSNFPEQIDQVKEFEQNCCKMAAIIYPTGQGSIVDIAQRDLQNFNIESLFQKQSRLKTMNQWSSQLFQEKLGNKTEYGIACGQPNSGVDDLVKLMASN